MTLALCFDLGLAWKGKANHQADQTAHTECFRPRFAPSELPSGPAPQRARSTLGAATPCKRRWQNAALTTAVFAAVGQNRYPLANGMDQKLRSPGGLALIHAIPMILPCDMRSVKQAKASSQWRESSFEASPNLPSQAQSV